MYSSAGQIWWQPIKTGPGARQRLWMDQAVRVWGCDPAAETLVRRPVLLLSGCSVRTLGARERQAAETQLRCERAASSQLFNGCEEAKSHSCEFSQLQVSLALNCREEQEKHFFILYTVFPAREFFWVTPKKWKTNLSFQSLNILRPRTMWKLIPEDWARQHLKHGPLRHDRKWTAERE